MRDLLDLTIDQLVQVESLWGTLHLVKVLVSTNTNNGTAFGDAWW